MRHCSVCFSTRHTKKNCLKVGHFHIHWKSEPRPGTLPYVSWSDAAAAAKAVAQTGDQYTIVEIGPKGWPHDYRTISAHVGF